MLSLLFGLEAPHVGRSAVPQSGPNRYSGDSNGSPLQRQLSSGAAIPPAPHRRREALVAEPEALGKEPLPDRGRGKAHL